LFDEIKIAGSERKFALRRLTSRQQDFPTGKKVAICCVNVPLPIRYCNVCGPWDKSNDVRISSTKNPSAEERIANGAKVAQTA
jgi:hypothetical protein